MRWLVIILTFLVSDVSAQQRVPWLTSEYLHQSAIIYVHAFKMKSGDTNDLIRVAEFKGYVAGVLDREPRDGDLAKTFDLCSQNVSLEQVTMRAALYISSGPLSRGLPGSVTVTIATYLACKDAAMQKP